MEAWKSINFTSLSGATPLFTLGFTTQRWGLEPFPANLIAIDTSLDFENANGETLIGSGLPYSCGADWQTVYHNDPPWRVVELNGQTGLGSEFFRVTDVNVTRETVVCEGPQTCEQRGGCYMILEDAFNDSNAVAMIHGLTVLVITILTLGVFFFLDREYEPKKRDEEGRAVPIGVQPEHLKNRYQPGSSLLQQVLCTSSKTQSEPIQKSSFLPAPITRTFRPVPIQKQDWAAPQVIDVSDEIVDYANPQDFSRSIVRCQNLLREVGGIDQQISGMEFAHADEADAVEALKERGNATFDEVRRIVAGLSMNAGLEDEHRVIVQAIARSLNGQPSPRY